ncbi:MAG: hypothetical protein OEY20_13850 [Gemmatimonadota bacterium]|nr:hypothetical protein [Gemmatimonadota bacterium]MDH4351695.1 hypothetical protein [Gemmatimonadota bacterium]MDH5198321.1 hypothetical protein [Gemmatimonadota bacterium]
MRRSVLLTLVALACLMLWIVLAFVRPMPSGWVHVPLVVAVLLAVRAIVAADDERAGGA